MNLEPRTSNRGITLVELLVVMAIIGLIVGISVPALTGYANSLRLKTTIRQVTSLISFARSMAISSHEDLAVVIDADEAAITLVRQASGEPLEQKVRLPPAVTVELLVGGQPAQEGQFVFRPTGALVGRTISLVLANQNKRHTITVTGTTGAVSVQ